MRLWTFHLPADAAPAQAAERAVVVKDGIAWLALLLPLPWLLYNRLWLASVAYLVLTVVLAFVGELLPIGEIGGMVLALLLNWWVALSGNDLRRGKLDKRGFRHAGSVAAKTREEAEIRFFAGYAAAQNTAQPAVTPRRDPPSYGGYSVTPADGVIGLFPNPEGSR